MSFTHHITTATISEIFAEEITARSGTVLDALQHGSRLYARSVLPGVRDVLPGDRLQGGVALRAKECEVWVHPYVFRQVCSNGAIMAQALQTRHLTDLNLRDPDEAEVAVREAVRACCEEDAFATSFREFRSATEVQADLAISLLPLLSRFRSAELFSRIVDQFFREPDRTRFSLTNAVTAVARGTRDPDTRWRLEELGGAIAAGKMPNPSPRNPGKAIRLAKHSHSLNDSPTAIPEPALATR
jgi:hypothetical protein